MKYHEIIRNVKADRMESAITAAAQLYLEKGIDEVKMTDIAEGCQLGVASLYRYFGTKQSFTVIVASHIWKEQLALFEGVYESEYFKAKSGIDQVSDLLKLFNVLLLGHSKFLRFVSDFDAYVMREGISPEELDSYENGVLDILPLMRGAIQKGVADGTVRGNIDIELYYFTVTHSLMNMCQKFAASRSPDGGYANGGSKELLLAIDMYVSYLRAQGQ